MKRFPSPLVVRLALAVTSFVGLASAHPAFAQLTNPLGSIEDPKIFLANIIRLALGLMSIIALVMFIYGGFTFLTSGGNSERIQKAKGTLVWATIGLVVIFGSYSLLSFIINVIVNSSTTQP